MMSIFHIAKVLFIIMCQGQRLRIIHFVTPLFPRFRARLMLDNEEASPISHIFFQYFFGYFHFINRQWIRFLILPKLLIKRF